MGSGQSEGEGRQDSIDPLIDYSGRSVRGLGFGGK